MIMRRKRKKKKEMTAIKHNTSDTPIGGRNTFSSEHSVVCSHQPGESTVRTVFLAYSDSMIAACCLQVLNTVIVTEGIFP